MIDVKTEVLKKHKKSSSKKSDFVEKKRTSDEEQSSMMEQKQIFANDSELNVKKRKNKKLKIKSEKHLDTDYSKCTTAFENFSENLDEEGNDNFLSNDEQYSDMNESGVKKSNKKKNKKINESLNVEKNLPVDVEIKDEQGPKKEKKKRKSEDSEETSPNKKVKLHNLKFKERKLVRKQKENEKYDIVTNLKTLWEDLRREDCKEDRKEQLLKQICVLLKSRVKEFAFAHDTVRVLECVFSMGQQEERSLLFEELKEDFILLSKSKYAKFIVLKILKYGSKAQKEAVMKAFDGKITHLVKHTEAAEVVEMAFNECANTSQRFQMIQEFFGSNYRFFKESGVHNIAEILQKNPEAKTSIINSMKEELQKVLKKSVVKHSLVHHVLLQFFIVADPASRMEIIESLNQVVPEILHTKDGSRVAMQCVWHGTHRDRKIIIKHMKSFVKKIAMEEHGHMVLLALFDCVDDTTLIEKIIIKELQDSLLEISQNVHGKKVLIYLLNPRDPHFFHPDIINILKAGDNNEISKKDPEKRRQELKMAIAKPLTELIEENIAELYRNNAFCLFTVTILKHTVGDKKAAYESISKLAAEPYTSESKNSHIIENSGSFFMLKQLVLNDSKDGSEVTFSEVLVNTVPDGVMKTWFHCNRGAFLLVSLIETEIPVVVNRVKEELTGCRKHLGKFNFKGAEILLKKLREFSVNTAE